MTEKDEAVFVTIDTEDAGRLIGHQGETLSSLQSVVNQIVMKKIENSKRVIIDVSNWRRSKEEELADRAQRLGKDVKESRKELELDPMPAWQRRVIHMTIQEMDGVYSESIGEGMERHLVIKPGDQKEEALEESEGDSKES